MNIYLLQCKGRVGYDCYDSQVIRARSEQEARELCFCGDEGKIWQNPEKVSCQVLPRRGKAENILASFNAG